jgi:hypothetical protein
MAETMAKRTADLWEHRMAEPTGETMAGEMVVHSDVQSAASRAVPSAFRLAGRTAGAWVVP